MKALFIGLGGAGQRHLRNLRGLVPEVRVAAVRRLNRSFEITDRLETVPTVDIVDRYDIALYDEIGQAVADFAPDLAVVANPTSHHAAATRALVEREVPVFLEKPICVTSDELDDLTALVDRTRVPVMVGYQLRFHPCVARAREFVTSGRMGRVYGAEARVHAYMPVWHEYEDFRDLYAARADLGGGVILTEIHEIDLLAWFFGRPRRVAAIGGHLSDLDIDVEDTVSAVMEMSDNGAAFPATLSLSFVQRPPSRHFAVYGEDARLVLDIPGDSLAIDDPDGNEIDRMDLTGFERNQMFVDALGHFLTCLRSGREPLSSLSRVSEGQRAALAIKAALLGGEMVAL